MKFPLPERASAWIRRGVVGLILWGAAGVAAVQAQTSTIITSHDAYAIGEDIVVSFSGGPGNAKDWVGIYPAGEVPDGTPPATRWTYGDGQGGVTGLREGTVTFAGGLDFAGDWTVFLLRDDGYEVLAQKNFTVVDFGVPLVRVDKRAYQPGEAITLSFSSGPGNAKDWVAVYPEGEIPDGNPPSLLWSYVDGTQTGSTGQTEGSVTFASGWATPGTYVAYLLLDDGYTLLASETFSVVAPTGNAPRVLSITPADGAVGQPPFYSFLAQITNGTSKVVVSSVVLKIDGQTVTAQTSDVAGLVSVRYSPSQIQAPLSTHSYQLTFQDDAVPPTAFDLTGSFTIADYQNITLPAPLYFENFDATPEGQVPTGWTLKSYSVVSNEELDLGNLDSASFANWLVLDVNRFTGSFVTYSNPDNPDGWETDYQRVLTPNPLNVLNGQMVTNLASGRMLFGNSGYRNGGSQYLMVYTPDYDLTGKTDVYVAFNSLYEQNQDSLGALEYSIDGGTSWLPVAYLINRGDLILVEGTETVDAVATLTATYGDVAIVVDEFGTEIGGSYGAYIAAPVSEALAPFIQGRLDDNASESKRVEKYRLPQADNQKTVRFRFAYSGTDSWYWGVDNFGLYSIPAVVPVPTLTYTVSANGLTVSWPADATGYVLETSTSLSQPDWAPVPGVTGTSATVPFAKAGEFLRLKKP